MKAHQKKCHEYILEDVVPQVHIAHANDCHNMKAWTYSHSWTLGYFHRWHHQWHTRRWEKISLEAHNLQWSILSILGAIVFLISAGNAMQSATDALTVHRFWQASLVHSHLRISKYARRFTFNIHNNSSNCPFTFLNAPNWTKRANVRFHGIIPANKESCRNAPCWYVVFCLADTLCCGQVTVTLQSTIYLSLN